MRRQLRLDRSGASAAEFALVLPLLLLMLFGIIDTARFLWATNQAEKATQMGARLAVVTNPVPGGLATANYVGVGGLTQGDIIPASALDPITCTRTVCSCTGNCPSGFATADSTEFDRIVTRMQAMKPDITAAQVRVSYRGSGLGYAGDPNGMEIAPLVTVELSGATFRPVSTALFGNPTFALPAFRTTLTAEDSNGSASN